MSATTSVEQDHISAFPIAGVNIVVDLVTIQNLDSHTGVW